MKLNPENRLISAHLKPETTGVSQEYLLFFSDETFLIASWMNIGGWDFDLPEDNPLVCWMKLELVELDG